MISAHAITKKYGEFTALDSVSFTIQRGEVVGLLGPNGAGKSTLMRILTCFMPPTSGYCTIGQDTNDGNSLKIRRRIGYLPENTPLYPDMTILEYLHFIADMHDLNPTRKVENLRRVMEVCSLKERMHQSIGELSRGFKQRVGLAAALIHDPEILILDEPTAGLDPNQIIEIRDLIRDIKKEKTVLLSTHILSEVEAVCDSVIILSGGKIMASGTVDEITSKMSSKATIIVMIEGSISGLTVLLEKVDGIGEVVTRRVNDTTHEVIIETQADLDPRREIIEVLTRHKYGFIGIERRDVTLEDAFTELTHNT